MELVKVKDFWIGKGQPLVVICGPCVIESEEFALSAAAFLKELFTRLGIHLIYKSSYDKANRSSYHSFRGPGLKRGLEILQKIRKELNLPVLTDVHSPEEAAEAGAICDVIQIPAFLCRQTDLITAAGQSGAVVNVKKGQFMAPWDMQNVVEKLLATGNRKILLTCRGTSFGYNNLVSDMRSIPILQKTGFPVCYDASHSVMLPGGHGSSSGGQREFIPTLTKAATAAGVDCLFLEAHPHPEKALSDKDSVYPFDQLEMLMKEVKQIYDIVHV
jgi:2-dehydro-3-deoxyphosphooctonate aldolase (KDO 8-P synthase)